MNLDLLILMLTATLPLASPSQYPEILLKDWFKHVEALWAKDQRARDAAKRQDKYSLAASAAD
jgi:hypothetical protein